MSTGRAGLVVLALLVVGVGLWFLRQATISRDVEMLPRSRTEVVFAVSTRFLADHGVTEAATSLFDSCRLTVDSAVVQRPTAIEPAVFRVVFEPALDRTDRLQLRGCLQDLQIQHVLGDVLRIGHQPPPPASE
jgi:hypothetical protein